MALEYIYSGLFTAVCECAVPFIPLCEVLEAEP